jgi:hypothetical protein
LPLGEKQQPLRRRESFGDRGLIDLWRYRDEISLRFSPHAPSGW